MLPRKHLLEGDRLSTVSVADLSRGLVMDMDDPGIRPVADPPSISHHLLRPGDILETGEGLVVGVPLPKRPTNRCIGVIGERAVLAGHGDIREPASEYLLLGEVRLGDATLLSVDDRHLVVVEAAHEAGQPLLVLWVAMGGDENEDVTRRRGAPEIERSPKAEILLPDVLQDDVLTGDDVESAVIRARVHDDGLVVGECLPLELGEQLADVLRLVVTADDDRRLWDRLHSRRGRSSNGL